MNNELTRSDIAEMEREIEYRKLVLRPALLEEVKTARAHGDLSENFEYHAAKKEKNANESRIRFLDRMIRTAQIIEEEETAEDEVAINKTVTVTFPEDGSIDTFTIVSTMRGDSLQNLISLESPLGKALLGHRVGETVTVSVSDAVQYPVVISAVEKTDKGESAKIRSF